MLIKHLGLPYMVLWAVNGSSRRQEQCHSVFIVANRMPCFVATALNMCHVFYELLINLMSTPIPKILDTPLRTHTHTHTHTTPHAHYVTSETRTRTIEGLNSMQWRVCGTYIPSFSWRNTFCSKYCWKQATITQADTMTCNLFRPFDHLISPHQSLNSIFSR